MCVIHDLPVCRVYLYVSKLALLCVLSGTWYLAAAPDTRLDPLLHGVENHYNQPQSLRLDFSQTYSTPKRPTQVERGTLTMRKPGKMRWDYAAPAGKVFLSDGKHVFFYTPENHRLEKSKLKESEDLRAPLAFLLGKLNFRKEFRSFSSRAEGDSTWVTAEPNSDQAAYTQVEFLVAPDSTIRRVRITAVDRSILDFTFSNEQMNAPVAASQFVFNPPAGTDIVEEKDTFEARQ